MFAHPWSRAMPIAQAVIDAIRTAVPQDKYYIFMGFVLELILYEDRTFASVKMVYVIFFMIVNIKLRDSALY